MSAIRLSFVGEQPEQLRGWPLTWSTDPATGWRWLTCATVRLGYLTPKELAMASPAAQLEIVVDWTDIARTLEAP